MKKHRMLTCLKVTALILTFLFCGTGIAGAGQYNPTALDTVVAEDGSVWEQVNAPGFGNSGNKAVVVMHV